MFHVKSRFELSDQTFELWASEIQRLGGEVIVHKESYSIHRERVLLSAFCTMLESDVGEEVYADEPDVSIVAEALTSMGFMEKEIPKIIAWFAVNSQVVYAHEEYFGDSMFFLENVPKAVKDKTTAININVSGITKKTCDLPVGVKIAIAKNIGCKIMDVYLHGVDGRLLFVSRKAVRDRRGDLVIEHGGLKIKVCKDTNVLSSYVDKNSEIKRFWIDYSVNSEL